MPTGDVSISGSSRMPLFIVRILGALYHDASSRLQVSAKLERFERLSFHVLDGRFESGQIPGEWDSISASLNCRKPWIQTSLPTSCRLHSQFL